MLHHSILCLFLASAFSLSAQQRPSPWQEVPEGEPKESPFRQIRPSQYRTLSLDLPAFASQLAQAPAELSGLAGLAIELPMPEGGLESFEIFYSPVMEAPLAARYPEIRTFAGRSLEHPSSSLRLDLTPAGVHAQVLRPEGSAYIDPYHSQSDRLYIAYHKRDLAPSFSWGCATEEGEFLPGDPRKPGLGEAPIGPELRQYRLAIAATGSYTQFHGGTVAGALAAIVTALNRLNGVYEREVGVRMILIANNDQIIYTNASTDPYDEAGGGSLLGQNQSTIDNVIGSANYDIGHLFSTWSGGGVASLGSVCENGNKARGITGSSSPVGDPYVIDFVAHEMGHQFGADHTFNSQNGSCGGGNRDADEAYEPGSGTTIMAYAGLCGSDNTQNNSDDYFHTISYDRIVEFTQNGSGNSCAQVIATGNQAPAVDAGTGGFFIPISTPFELSGSGSDPDGDPLTYCWEQFDLGPAGNLSNPSGNAPLFRSFLPTASPTRVFPRIGNIVANSTSLGERLPTYSRDLSFRLTARDNQLGGGGVNYDVITFKSTDLAGPFVLTQPNTFLTWAIGTVENVSWNVANTSQAPVSCAFVDIFLSTDGGFTYPHLLAAGRPNTGNAQVIVPNLPGTSNRVKVKGAGNVFFDISNANFTIAPASTPGFALFPLQNSVNLCSGSSASIVVLTASQAGFSSPLTLLSSGLPPAISATFVPATIAPGDSFEVLLSAAQGIAPGTYSFNIGATASTGQSQVRTLVVEILPGLPPPPVLRFPADGAVTTSRQATLSWDSIASGYLYELALSPSFAAPLTASGSTAQPYADLPAPLASSTVYYWRVRSENECGAGPYSPVSAFQTGLCQQVLSSNVPVTIPAAGNPAQANSTLNVPFATPIEDLNVIGLEGRHTALSDLEVSLITPSLIVLPLFAGACTQDDENFKLNFDDQAYYSALPCPPTTAEFFRPAQPLSSLSGQPANGTWTLRIRDTRTLDGGTLDAWGLELCFASADPPSVVKNDTLFVYRGDSATVSNQYLKTTDAFSQATAITYTLVSLPASGSLRKNNAPLAAGATFTQSDIDQSLISYRQDGSQVPQDSFRFAVSNALGGWLGGETFYIEVGPLTSVDPLLAAQGFEAYPSPAEDWLEIQVSGPLSAGAEVELLTALGQRLRSERLPAAAAEASLRWQLGELAPGLYFLRLKTERGSISRKVLLR